jgi:hypothetical protein
MAVPLRIGAADDAPAEMDLARIGFLERAGPWQAPDNRDHVS